MKNLKVAAISIILAGITVQTQAGKLPKNCHAVKPICLEKRTGGKPTRRGATCRDQKPKVVCDKVETKEELLARIEAQEEKKIFKCLKSIATNKKSMGIIPVGNEGEDKFEIKDNSLTADQSKKPHLLVNAATNRVQKCTNTGPTKECRRASWSDLKKVMKDNIQLSKADPFKPVKEKFKEMKEDLDNKKSDFESKEEFVRRMAESDGEGIKKKLDQLQATDPAKAEKQRVVWKKIFAEKLGVPESDFSNLSKLKAVKKDKISEALKEFKDETRKKIADLPEDERKDKKLYKDKIVKVSESAKDGKKLCHDIGLDSLATVIKTQNSSRDTASDELDSSHSK